MNSLSVCLSGSIFTSPSFLRDSFVGYRNISPHYLLASFPMRNLTEDLVLMRHFSPDAHSFLEGKFCQICYSWLTAFFF